MKIKIRVILDGCDDPDENVKRKYANYLKI
jgi:hypothetical protein